MAVSKVFKICMAYEQGYGEGFHDKPKKDPFKPGVDCSEAWNIGYEAGQTAVKEINALRGGGRMSDTMLHEALRMPQHHAKPQPETWTLTAPDGRFFTGISAIQCCREELRSRVTPEQALENIISFIREDENQDNAARMVYDVMVEYVQETGEYPGNTPEWQDKFGVAFEGGD